MALEFAGITKRQIEFYQILGHVKVFLWNFRWIDFLRFIFEFRYGEWNVFKRTVLNLHHSSLKCQRPNDYQVLLSSEKTFQSIIGLIQSTEDWKKHQNEDQKRIKK